MFKITKNARNLSMGLMAIGLIALIFGFVSADHFRCRTIQHEHFFEINGKSMFLGWGTKTHPILALLKREFSGGAPAPPE